MSSFFSPKVLPPSTIEELEARADINFNNPWFSSRMPWIHVMSLAASCQPTSGNNQVNKGIFTTKRDNGTYSVTLEDGTTVNTPSYIVSQTGRPSPTIMGIDVKKQGELGSTKRATVKIQAFTDDQFNEIAKCFFIPGMSVRVQWGWNLSAKGTKGASPITEVLLDTEATKKMLELQKINPNYDGVQGRVVSYGANLADNHIWQITIDIIAAGSMIADVKANDYSLGCVCEEQVPEKDKDTTKKVTTKVSNLDAVLLGLAKQETTVSDLQRLYGSSAKSYCYEYFGYPIDENGAEDSSKFLGFIDNAQYQRETYIPLGLLQDIVTNSVQVALRGKKAFKFDSSDSKLTQPQGSKNGNGPKQIFSCDPRVAILPGATEYSPKFFPGFGNASLTPPPSAYNDDGTITLNNILINVKSARKVLKGMEGGNDSVLDYISKLMGDINHACGNPWEFAYVDNTHDLLDDVSTETKLNDTGAIISIIDTKALIKTPPQPYSFHAGPTRSNVLSIQMDLKLTEAMKTQALYAGGVGGSATKQSCNDRFNVFQQFSGDNLGQSKDAKNKPVVLEALKLYKEKNEKSLGEGTITFYIKQAAKDNNFVVDIDMINTFKTAYNEYSKNCGSTGGSCGSDKKEQETYTKRLTGLKSKIENATVDAVYGDLVELNTVKNIADPCAGSILPVEFSVGLDGIGGIKFGQLVTCDKFPKGYTDFMHHQVIGVEHTVDMNGWVTSVKTIGRYKNKK